MKGTLWSTIMIVVVFAFIAGFNNNVVLKTKAAFEPIAVVELFTSQGCSSCPPADILLAQTIEKAKKEGRNIFALSYHVDYWNRLGWKDPFSDKIYSQRQKDYVTSMKLDGVYTPQMVVNGSNQFVGSDNNSLTQFVARALQIKATVYFKTLKVTSGEGKPIKVQYELEGDFAGATINFALVSLIETTVIKRGENTGRTLQNENVVRQWRNKMANAAGEIELDNEPGYTSNNSAIVAFVQEEKSLKIIGAAMIKN